MTHHGARRIMTLRDNNNPRLPSPPVAAAAAAAVQVPAPVNGHLPPSALCCEYAKNELQGQ